MTREVDGLPGDRRVPSKLRPPGVASIIRVRATVWRDQAVHTETRHYISSALLTAERTGRTIRGHWGIESQLHWVLDVAFGEDQSRPRKGFGARNMAVIRHFALNITRSTEDNNSIKPRRKLAAWKPDCLDQPMTGQVL
jgi:predicted transposase YbfD/YdcC